MKEMKCLEKIWEVLGKNCIGGDEENYKKNKREDKRKKIIKKITVESKRKYNERNCIKRNET